VLAIAWIAWRSVRDFANYDSRLGWLQCSWVLPAIAVILLASIPLQSNLRFGQVSVFLVLLVLIDLIALGDSRWQGALTGLAGAIKLTPLLFVAFYWIAGKRRTSVVATLSFVVTTLAAWGILPKDSYAYWSHELWHTTDLGTLGLTGNQSLYGVLLRAHADNAVITLAWVAGSLLVVGLALWRGRLALQRGQPLLAASIVGAATVIASPISWTHHQLWLVLAAFGVVSHKPILDWANRVLLLAVMLHGVRDVAWFGAVGAWIGDNERFLLAVYISCLMPIADVRLRRVTTAVTADAPTATEEHEAPPNRRGPIAAPVTDRSSLPPNALLTRKPIPQS
jgi:alpha-1,2-mannosyltransferase